MRDRPAHPSRARHERDVLAALDAEIASEPHPRDPLHAARLRGAEADVWGEAWLRSVVLGAMRAADWHDVPGDRLSVALLEWADGPRLRRDVAWRIA